MWKNKHIGEGTRSSHITRTSQDSLYLPDLLQIQGCGFFRVGEGQRLFVWFMENFQKSQRTTLRLITWGKTLRFWCRSREPPAENLLCLTLWFVFTGTGAPLFPATHHWFQPYGRNSNKQEAGWGYGLFLLFIYINIYCFSLNILIQFVCHYSICSGPNCKQHAYDNRFFTF